MQEKDNRKIVMGKVTAYTFAIPNLPVPTLFNRIFRRRQLKAAADILKELDGLIGITVSYPKGTLLHFETLNQAKIARNRITAMGNRCGIYIMETELDDANGKATVMKPAD